jgi:DNA-binding response OmpR family regulator
MTEHILVVDDDPDFAEAVKMTLEVNGFAVEVAFNGRVALESIERKMPAIIILDMLMPVMDGWEFAREFRRIYGRAAPIIVLSAAESAQARASEIEAEDVLSKPFRVQRLLECIRRLLGTEVAPPPT